jgi:hypothetical protein
MRRGLKVLKQIIVEDELAGSRVTIKHLPKKEI